jgi:hypothetical protein
VNPIRICDFCVDSKINSATRAILLTESENSIDQKLLIFFLLRVNDPVVVLYKMHNFLCKWEIQDSRARDHKNIFLCYYETI